MKKKLNLVQLVRGIAIVFVMLGHLNLQFYDHAGFDWFGIGTWGRTGGVDLFFVISGFMIAYLYSRYIGSKEKSILFLKKRLIRILPLYWMVTLATFTLFVLFPQLSDAGDRKIAAVMKSLFFLNPDPIMSVAWSLSYIIFFYLTFSLVIAKPGWMKKLLPAWFGVIILVLAVDHTSALADSFLFRIDNLEIWAGVLLAYLVGKIEVRRPWLYFTLGISAFTFIWMNNMLSFMYIESETIRPLVYCLGSFFILLSIVSIDLKKEIIIPKSLRFLGDASFSIYLTHAPFIQFYIIVLQKTGLTGVLGYNVSMVVIAILTVLTGMGVYKVLERPMNHFLAAVFITPQANRKMAVAGKVS